MNNTKKNNIDMLFLKMTIFKNNCNKRLFFISVLFFINSSCSSVPYQEMSDARQMISVVNEEIISSGFKGNLAIGKIIEKAKKQLFLAKQSLKNNEYGLAKKYAKEASKLAHLARTEIQQKNK